MGAVSCYHISNHAQPIHQSGSIDIDMIDTSFPRFRSSKSTILSQVVAVVVSTGINYLLASNLGLFTRLSSIPSRPLTGKVKLVELTPAEKTRVPAAAKADPLVARPSPLSSSSMTSPPFSQGNQSARVLPFPKVTPNKAQLKKSNSFNPKTTSKNPNKPAITGKPLVPSKTSKPGKLPIPIKTKTALPTSLDSEPSQTPNTQPTNNPTPDNLDDSPASPGNPNKSSPSSPSRQSSGKSDNSGLQSIQQTFNQDIQKLKKALGASNIIERPPQRLPLRPYPQKTTTRFRCSGEKNGYILVAITIDDQGTVDNSIVPLSSSQELGDKSNNPFIGKALEESDASAQRQHAARIPAIKAAEKGKKVLYPFIFEYDAKTC